MAVKSIISVDVDDAAFKRFQALYDKYQQHLAKTPGLWKSAGGEAKKVQRSFEAAATALVTQAEAARRAAESGKAMDHAAKSGARSWTVMARATHDVASNIAKATLSFAKWSGILTAFTGLIGAGGLFGIERLAGSVFAGRRSSVGLGLPYGAQTAFGLQFGRVVDPGSFLGAISAARANPALFGPLAAIGVRTGDLAGDTGAAGVKVLDHLRAFARRTPDNLLGLYAERYGLGQFGITEQELRRLKATTPEEFAAMKRAYASNAGALGLDAGTQKAWSDFKVQLSTAGAKIENVFVKGLSPLVPQLTKLSGAFADAVRVILGSQGFKEVIEGLASGLKVAASYLASPQFKDDVKTFVTDFELVAQKIATGLKWLGVIPDNAGPASPETSPHGVKAPPGMHWDYSHGFPVLQGNNPGNIKTPGGASFQSYPTPEAGIRAMAGQLRRDEYGHGQDTLRQIIYGNGRWPGYTTTDREAYLRNVARTTGIGPDEKLNLADTAQLAKVVSAMTKQETGNSRWRPAVVVEILNNTGGNAYVQASQVAQ